MNLGSITEAIRFHSGRLSSNDIEKPWLNEDINRVYQKLAASYDWNGLIVRGEEFTTEADTDTYYLPLPLIRIVGNRLIYDVDNTTSGPDTLTINDTRMAQYWTAAVNADLTAPRTGLIIGGGVTVKATPLLAVTPLDYGATTVRMNAVTGIEIGDWLTFGIDSNATNPGDYAYQVTAIGISSVTISPEYRGPTLALDDLIYVRPTNTKRLQLFPGFSEYDKTVSYDWVRQPQRLYLDIDAPEVPELSDAIIFQCLAENFQYHNPSDIQGSLLKMTHYKNLAKEALKEARQNAAQGI